MTTRQISDLPTGSPHQRVDHFCALLDNIRSIHNVGSMFRTADGAGLGHLYLCGITATPEQPKLAKAALGAHETVPWSYTPNAVDLAQSLKASGRRLWALERLDSDSPITLPSVIPTDATAGSIVLIVGNEKAGVDPALVSLCERIIPLPMMGHKGSLNAAVAFGIAVYALRFAQGPPLDSGPDST